MSLEIGRWGGSCFHSRCSQPQMPSGTLGMNLLEGKGRWLFAWLVYCTFTLRKSPLLSLTTFPCEVDGLVTLLDEESSLPVVHVSRRELGGKPRAHPEFGSCTYSSSGFALVAACWKQRSQGAVGGQSPGALLASRLACCPPQTLAQLWSAALTTWVMPQAKPSLPTVD